MAITNEIFIVTKSDINVLGYVKRKISSCIKVIYTASSFEWFVKTSARHSRPVACPLLHISWIPFLVVSEVGKETNLIGDSATNGKTTCI